MGLSVKGLSAPSWGGLCMAVSVPAMFFWRTHHEAA